MTGFIAARRTIAMAWRSLAARPLRTVPTLFGVVLGVAVILAINTTNVSTLHAITEVFTQASGKAHLVITAADESAQGFASDALNRIEQAAGVGALVPVMRGQALLADEASPTQVNLSFFGAVGGGLLLYGVDPTVDRQARDYKILEGQFLGPNRSAYDIVLVKNYADEKKIRVGNEVALVTPSGTVRLKVVGLMDKDGPGQLNSGAFGAVPLQTAEDIFLRSGDLDQVDVVARPEASSGAALAELKSRLQARLGPRYTVTYPAAQGERVSQMLTGYQMGLNMFSAIALFVGGFLVYNAFSMTVVERTREIGMLRALGMTRRQVLGQILAEAAMIGVAGSVLGLAAGLALSQGLMKVMEVVVAQEVQDLQVPLSGLISALLVGVGVTLAAAAIPARQASRISPLEALRVRGASKEGWFVRRGWIAGIAVLVLSLAALAFMPGEGAAQEQMRQMFVMNLFLGGLFLIPVAVTAGERLLRPLLHRLYGPAGQLGSRNVQRARLRTALTVAALMTGIAMLLSIRAITAAFGGDIQSWIERYIGGDVYVHSSLPMQRRVRAQHRRS